VSQVISQKFFLNDLIPAKYKDAIHSIAPRLLSQNNELLSKIFKPIIDITYLESIAKEIAYRCKHLVIIGTGASSNIPKILFSLSLQKNFQIYFLEDADTTKFESLISKLDPVSTRFLVITKSGQTVEILALLSLCLQWAEEKLSLPELKKIFYFITSKQKDNYVLDIANKLGATIIEHPAFSGRYSFFSSVGLLPATLAGFDISLILKHSSQCIDNLFVESSWILDGATYLSSMSRKYHNAVFMTYSSCFSGLALYLRQLLSESLGKSAKGVNPVMFEGNIDQHSQLQSYLDGLPDKFFTILMPNVNLDSNKNFVANRLFDITYLKDKTLSDINQLQINSVTELMLKAKKNIRIIEVKNFNEKFVAEIVICFMMETILYAELNAIDPFTQTAIETMKHFVRVAAIE
jgi:glucose-6-phosphate isomerase